VHVENGHVLSMCVSRVLLVALTLIPAPTGCLYAVVGLTLAACEAQATDQDTVGVYTWRPAGDSTRRTTETIYMVSTTPNPAGR
jgi:hypothetical protein